MCITSHINRLNKKCNIIQNEPEESYMLVTNRYITFGFTSIVIDEKDQGHIRISSNECKNHTMLMWMHFQGKWLTFQEILIHFPGKCINFSGKS